MDPEDFCYSNLPKSVLKADVRWLSKAVDRPAWKPIVVAPFAEVAWKPLALCAAAFALLRNQWQFPTDVPACAEIVVCVRLAPWRRVAAYCATELIAYRGANIEVGDDLGL